MQQKEPMRRCQLQECRAACCLYGVWMDAGEVETVRALAGLVRAYLPETQADPAGWWDGREEEDPFMPSGRVIHTTVVAMSWHYGGTGCVFLRPDYKCALQVASAAAGWHPWRLKPFYCVLHPLDLDDAGRITLDSTDLLLDEPASCLRPALQPILLAETFADELEYLLGEGKRRWNEV